MDFRYKVVTRSVDDARSSARFLNPESAHRWATRLATENARFEIFRITEGKETSISLNELKKEATAWRKGR